MTEHLAQTRPFSELREYMLHHAEPFRGGAGGVEVTSRRREGRTEEVGGMRRWRRERRKEDEERGKRNRNRTHLKILGSFHLFICGAIFSVRFPLLFYLQLGFTKKNFNF